MGFTELNKFVNKWEKQRDASIEMATEYLPLAQYLPFGDEKLVRRVTELLTNNISTWAKRNSPIYAVYDVNVIDKESLTDKSTWYVADLLPQSQPMSTSGSTTGIPFQYLRWEPALRQIEVTNHYKMILEEFKLLKKPKVLYFLLNIKRPGDVIQITHNHPNFTECHGADEAECHFVEKTQLYYDDQNEFYKQIIQHLCKQSIDVILSSSQFINALTYHLRRLGIKQRIARLLSNTCEMLLEEDMAYLKENRLVSYICDHMRCWDGGAGFFTCRYGTYHLADNLSWCYQGDENRLICTDYFSFPSPFVDYWNGDYCVIDNHYRRCRCGRLYRPFRFLASRPFSLKGNCITEWRKKIEKEGIEGLKQIRVDAVGIEVISYFELTQEAQIKMREIMHGYNVMFRIEER